MHISYRRSYLFGLVITLTIFLLVTGTVGARWLRLGDIYNGLLAARVDRVCEDGVQVSIAFFTYTANGTAVTPFEAGSSNRYGSQEIYVASYETRPQLGTFRFTKVVNGSGLSILTKNSRIELPDFVRGPSFAAPFYFPQQCPDNNSCFQETFSEWYTTIKIPWDVVPDTERYYLGISLELLTPIDVIAPHKLDDCRLFISNDFFTSDNRLNRAQRDLGATAAIFCEDNSVKVYGINAESQGFFAFSVTQDEIDALGQPATNTLLDSFPSPFGGDIRLYLLTTGELQLNAPGLPPESWKEYVFTWAGCTT